MTELVNGNMTNGEAKVLAAMAAEVNPDDVEMFIVITFGHVSTHDHLLVVSGNVTVNPDATIRLLQLAQLTTERLEGNNNGAPSEASKMVRFRTHVRRTWGHFR